MIVGSVYWILIIATVPLTHYDHVRTVCFVPSPVLVSSPLLLLSPLPLSPARHPQKLRKMLGNVGHIQKAELVDDGDEHDWKRGIVMYELKEDAQTAIDRFHDTFFEVIK